MPGITDALDPELAAAFAAMPKAGNGALIELSDIPGCARSSGRPRPRCR
ncbi:hypothetical protein [Paractinoplanes durhamensis]